MLTNLFEQSSKETFGAFLIHIMDMIARTEFFQEHRQAGRLDS